MVYYEWWDKDRREWVLGKMNIFKALICLWSMPNDFHIIPRSKIVFD